MDNNSVDLVHFYHETLVAKDFDDARIKAELKYLRAYLGSVQVHDPANVSSEQLYEFFAGAVSRWSFTYFSRILRTVKACYKALAAAGMVVSDPARGLPRPADFVRPEGRGRKLSELLKEFKEYLESGGLRAATVECRVSDIDRFAGTTRLLEASRADLAKYVSSSRWSISYRRRNRASLICFYGWVFERGYLDENLADSLPKVRGKVPRQHPIGEAQLQAAFDAAPPMVKAMIALAGTLGLRRSEIAGLHMRHRKDRLLKIVGKGGSERTIPLNDVTFELLELLENSSDRGYYFSADGGESALHASTVYKWIKHYIGDATLHSLRHRTATVALNKSNNIRVVQEILGHSSVATTQQYTDVTHYQLQRLVTDTDWVSSRAEGSGDDDRLFELISGLSPEKRKLVLAFVVVLADSD